MELANAKKIVNNKFGSDHSVSFIKRIDGVFVFLAESYSDMSVPSALVVAVDSNTGKMGYSIFSEEEAISSCKG